MFYSLPNLSKDEYRKFEKQSSEEKSLGLLEEFSRHWFLHGNKLSFYVLSHGLSTMLGDRQGKEI